MIVGLVTHITLFKRLSLTRLKTLVLLGLLVFILPAIFIDTAANAALKPRLSYLLSNPENLDSLAAELNLTASQKDAVERIIERETDELRRLKEASDMIVESKGRSLDEKKDLVGKMEFNSQAETRESIALSQIKDVVGNQSVAFDKWVAELWAKEVAAHGIAAFGAANSSLAYRVFATQYDGIYSNYEVALPDKYVKFANHGWEHAPGYERNDYAVDLSYGGNSLTGVKILDVGPWNIDDNYWNAAGASPRPRRLFTDLPQGMPEAQAAFFDNYNGGQDQFGREVLNPAGIDLTPDVAADLGIGYLQNKWIDVSYVKANRGQTPVVSVRAPKYSTNVSRNTAFRVYWSINDPVPPSGLGSYDIQYKIGRNAAWQNWLTGTTNKSAEFMGRPGRTYYFRARATDGIGNTGKFSKVKWTIVPYDNNTLVRRRRGFGHNFKKRGTHYYLGTVRYSTRGGDYIVYQFTSNRVAIIATRNRNRSDAKIFINGKYVKTIKTYAKTRKYRKVVFKKTWRRRRKRTIKIVNVGNRRRLDIDGLGVMR